MSTLSIEAIDASALSSSDVNLKDFSLEILNSKPFYAFEVPKYVLDTTVKVFSVGDRALAGLCKGFETIANAENLVMFFQDVISIPSEVGKLKEKTIGYLNGTSSLKALLNQTRKLVGFAGSSLGDYFFSCEALKDLKIPVEKIHVVSAKAGLYGSSVGAASRIYDYATNDFEEEKNSYPVSHKVRNPIIESKRSWDCARDVSILGLCLLGICFSGVAGMPAAPVAALSGVVLGSRLVSVYKDFQLKKIDEANPYKTCGIKQLKKN